MDGVYNEANLQLVYETGVHHSLKVAASKFRKLDKLKINKLKSSYTSKSGFIFQTWLKDIRTHVEDCQLNQKEVVQVIKNYIAKHARAENWVLYQDCRGGTNISGLYQSFNHHLSVWWNSLFINNWIFQWNAETKITRGCFGRWIINPGVQNYNL